MKFLIEYTTIIESKSLTYDIEDCSFDTEPSVQWINFDVVVNKLNLTAVADDNKIVQLWGFCEYKEWIKSNYEVPPHKIGFLKVADKLEGGFAYSISKDDFPVFVNVQTGWVCIGAPKKKSNAIEFINNCVAVIDDDEQFVSLWLRPQSLPQL